MLAIPRSGNALLDEAYFALERTRSTMELGWSGRILTWFIDTVLAESMSVEVRRNVIEDNTVILNCCNGGANRGVHVLD